MTAPDNRKTGSPRSDEVIASEYVMGALSREDCRVVEERLARDGRFAAIVRRWERSLADLTLDGDPPPVLAVPRFSPRAEACDVVFSGRVSGGFWNSLAFWRSFGCLALAAGAGLVVAVLFTPPAERGRAAAVLTGEGLPIGIHARYDARSGRIHLTPAAGQGRNTALKLWIVENGKPGIALGRLPADGDGTLSVPAGLRQRLVEGAVLAVSAETPRTAPGRGDTVAVSGPLVFE
ncbi:anti-sigma factor [Shinella daejeonensis]|uniref:anti-sigma factor n=1 Tax=Shinella daejeonensis TaxID=659017 RepID=UPI0020C7622F|nr:anti-sigma factor [Shinella daejeonensis]MCP8896383.1 anti-sigma factor [Shinella daejeonensis]